MFSMIVITLLHVIKIILILSMVIREYLFEPLNKFAHLLICLRPRTSLTKNERRREKRKCECMWKLNSIKFHLSIFLSDCSIASKFGKVTSQNTDVKIVRAAGSETHIGNNAAISFSFERFNNGSQNVHAIMRNVITGYRKK
ncbi:hypothetical protein V1478_002068 [Vespula squamosa]|uniref:Uncharacterized protein n=1 Tax=Vespula squamosa TaxID=30214 RepID=A0ABD2BYX5_VESSQ